MMAPLSRRALVIAALFWAAAVEAAEPADEPERQLHAVRTARPIKLDGEVSPQEWSAAPAFSNFVQNFPTEGAAPTERTEIRVMYDDKNLYVGAVCFDQHPAEVLRNLGRRDNPPPSDSVTIGVDSSHDHATAYAFGVNAGGVLSDMLIFGGSNFTSDWDAVWDARVKERPDGWSAEFVIPLSILKFSAAREQTWGFAVRREVAHKHETDDSILIPRAGNQFVQRFNHLVGLVDLKPHADIEVAPYLAARAVIRPQYSDATLPHPRLVDPLADLGVDVKAALLSHLTLSATINPDFGQVEADQIILNLTTYEVFRPEKRPFFLQGMDLFQPEGNTNTQQLFYSRRVGLSQPIYGAAKVTGTIADGLDIALLDAVVGGDVQSAYTQPGADVTGLESVPDRRFRYHLAEPFSFGPNDALPEFPPVPQNYFVGIVRKQILGNSTIGATFTAATPLTPNDCPESVQQDVSPNELSPRCLAHGGNTAGLSWNLRTANGDWQFLGQADASEEVGGPASVIQYDGTQIKRGDLGWGTYLTAGKLGGEPYRLLFSYEVESPKLDLNALGVAPAFRKQLFFQ